MATAWKPDRYINLYSSDRQHIYVSYSWNIVDCDVKHQIKLYCSSLSNANHPTKQLLTFFTFIDDPLVSDISPHKTSCFQLFCVLDNENRQVQMYEEICFQPSSMMYKTTPAHGASLVSEVSDDGYIIPGNELYIRCLHPFIWDQDLDNKAYI